MATVCIGNHASMRVPLKEREHVRTFYRDVLGCSVVEQADDADVKRDIFRMVDGFYFIFLYGDFPEESAFLRTAKSIWLELKSDNVEEMRRLILGFGVRELEIPDSHLYFQAPGGQVFRLVGAGEDLSKYEGNGVVAAASATFLSTLDSTP